MKLILGVICCIFVAGIRGAAFDWKTPEGCSCSCPVTYNGPYPPPSSLQHLRDPWTAAVVGKPVYNQYDPYNPSYNAWNRPAVVDPYLAANPYIANRWNAQWNRTWPNAGAGQFGSSAWNRNQWGAGYNPNQWNNTWNRQPWNRYNTNYAGYAGVDQLRAAVAANDASSNGQSNEVQRTASSTQNPLYYYGIRQKVSDTAASASEYYPQGAYPVEAVSVGDTGRKSQQQQEKE